MEDSSMDWKILNDVVEEKLRHFVLHIVDKLTTKIPHVFTPEEQMQLIEMFHIQESQLYRMINILQFIYQNAIVFDHFDQDMCAHQGLNEDVIAILSKVWRKKYQSLMTTYSTEINGETIATDILQGINWDVRLEMGQRKHTGLTNPLALLQLNLQPQILSAMKNNNVDDKFEIELGHKELSHFFDQLNAIQKEFDSIAME